MTELRDEVARAVIKADHDAVEQEIEPTSQKWAYLIADAIIPIVARNAFERAAKLADRCARQYRSHDDFEEDLVATGAEEVATAIRNLAPETTP